MHLTLSKVHWGGFRNFWKGWGGGPHVNLVFNGEEVHPQNALFITFTKISDRGGNPLTPPPLGFATGSEPNPLDPPLVQMHIPPKKTSSTIFPSCTGTYFSVMYFKSLMTSAVLVSLQSNNPIGNWKNVHHNLNSDNDNKSTEW